MASHGIEVVEPGPALKLGAGDATVDLYPAAGGRIGQVDVAGSPLLRGPEHSGAGWSAWGSYPLVPWCNRIPGGIAVVEGVRLDIPVNWPDGTAIHGLGASRPWDVVAADRTHAELRVSLAASAYRVDAFQSFRMGRRRLSLTLGVRNAGDGPAPIGLGIHPWFVAAPIRVPADSVWPGDTPIPDGPPEAVTGAADLRLAGMPAPMDRCFTDLTDDAAQIGDVRLSWTGPVTQVVVYSGEPGWVCVEPVTMANDGFGMFARGRSRTGVVMLAPGDECRVDYELDWSALLGAA